MIDCRASASWRMARNDRSRGGKIAGNARKELEKELGRSVVSKKNFLSKRKEIDDR